MEPRLQRSSAGGTRRKRRIGVTKSVGDWPLSPAEALARAGTCHPLSLEGRSKGPEKGKIVGVSGSLLKELT